MGRGGAGLGRGGAERPRLRLPRPRPRPPQSRAARAGGDACAPPRAACAGARKVRGGAGLRAGPAAEGERALGLPAVAGGGEGRSEGRGGSGEPGRKGSANIVTAGYGNYLRSCRRSPLRLPKTALEARRPPVWKDSPTATQDNRHSFLPDPATGGESCPLLTFYSSFPKDRILIKLTSWEASAPGRLPLLQADVRWEPVFLLGPHPTLWL